MKKFTLTIAFFGLLIFSLITRVGASSIMWSQTYGGTNGDNAEAIVQTGDGGYALAGRTESFSDDNSTLCWLVKVDSSGNMEWNRTYGGQETISSSATVFDMVQTNDGRYALTCQIRKTFGEETESGFWLIKVDSSGNMEWNQTYWGQNAPHSLIQTADGGYAIVGDGFSFVKTDSLGNIMWIESYGGGGPDYARSLVQTIDGGYVLLGEKFPGWPFSGISVLLLVKTDSAGNVLWNQTYGGAEEAIEFLGPLVQTADGGYAMAGSTDAFGEGSDFWLIKTDSLGNIMWNMTYGGANSDRALDLIQTGDGGYALTGYTRSFGAGEIDFWVVKTDSFGNMQWSQTYGGQSYDSAHSIVQTRDGGYALAGSTGSFGAGENDVWLIKTDEYGNIPEFPSWTALLVSLIAVLVVTIVYRRKLRDLDSHVLMDVQSLGKTVRYYRVT